MSLYYSEKPESSPLTPPVPPPEAAPQTPQPTIASTASRDDPIFSALAQLIRPDLHPKLFITSSTTKPFRVNLKRTHEVRFVQQLAAGKGPRKLQHMAGDREAVRAYCHRAAESMWKQVTDNLPNWAKLPDSLSHTSSPDISSLVSPWPPIARVFTCESCEGQRRRSCGRCNAKGRRTCSRCEGEGRQACSACDGKGEFVCRRCNGTGTVNEMLNGPIYEPFAKNVLTNQGFGNYQCPSCHGARAERCHACQQGEVVCSGCGGSKIVSCDGCGGAGSNPCDPCDATGLQHELTTPACVVHSHDTLSVVGDEVDRDMLTQLTARHVGVLGDFERNDIASQPNQLTITYALFGTRTTITFESSGTPFVLHRWGPRQYNDFKGTIYDPLLEPDVAALEKVVKPRRWWRERGSIPRAVDQLLASPVFADLVDPRHGTGAARVAAIESFMSTLESQGWLQAALLKRGLAALSLAAPKLLAPQLRPAMLAFALLACLLLAAVYLTPGSTIEAGGQQLAILLGRDFPSTLRAAEFHESESFVLRAVVALVLMPTLLLLWLPVGWFQRRRFMRGRYRALLLSAKSPASLGVFARSLRSWLALLWMISTTAYFIVRVLPHVQS